MNTKKLDQSIAIAIASFINHKRDEASIKAKYPNVLLREDVLALLGEYCTVIYYPLENEANNGFHITGLVDKSGVEKHFVYINTNQTIEKQVFTAAHELGHVWDVDEYVAEQCDIKLDDQLSEDIINRFAAELLMPKDFFEAAFIAKHKKYSEESGRTLMLDALKMIVDLINLFFVPYKSVVHRFYELNIINEADALLLWGEGECPESEINDNVQKIMTERGYTQFINPTKRKWIDKLPELLERAEHRISPSKVAELRRLFELSSIEPVTDQLTETIDLTIKKEDE